MVITTTIPADRIAGRLEGYVEKYAGGETYQREAYVEGILGTKFRGYIIDGCDWKNYTAADGKSEKLRVRSVSCFSEGKGSCLS